MVHSLLRGGAVAAALTVTIGLASTLTACASSTTTANAGSAGAAAGSSTTPTPTPTPSASSSASPVASVNPGGPIQSATAQAQTSTLPSGAKYVAIQRETKSADGRTLYLVAESQGGACGNYTVVLQESATAVHIGLAKMPVKGDVVCPMYITARTFLAKLSSPLGNRPVIDLATNGPVGP